MRLMTAPLRVLRRGARRCVLAGCPDRRPRLHRALVVEPGPDTNYPTPAEVATGLDIDLAQWPARRGADMPRRQAVGPGGQTEPVTDHVLTLRRATG